MRKYSIDFVYAFVSGHWMIHWFRKIDYCFRCSFYLLTYVNFLHFLDNDNRMSSKRWVTSLTIYGGRFFSHARACQSSVNIWPSRPLGLFRGTSFFRSQRFACVHCQLRRVALFPISNAGTHKSGRDLKTMYWPIKFSLCYQGKLTLYPQHIWICLLGIP